MRLNKNVQTILWVKCEQKERIVFYWFKYVPNMAFQIELLLTLLFCLVIVSPEVHQFKLWELPLWASTYKLVNVFFAYSTNMPMLFLQLFLFWTYIRFSWWNVFFIDVDSIFVCIVSKLCGTLLHISEKMYHWSVILDYIYY